jgi:LemA protein
MREGVRSAWAQIDVELKRRHDLVPNLVETVKGYASHEKETLENVIAARNAAATTGGVSQSAAAENQLSGALRQLFAVAEAYPDLKANSNFLSLQNELSETEDRVANRRSPYNRTVEQYNAKVQTVPTNLIANTFGFQQEPFFEAEPEAATAPKVSF